jgi:rubrerythrin
MPTPSNPVFIYVVITIIIFGSIFFAIFLFQTKPWTRKDEQYPNGNSSETQKFQKELEQLGEKVSQITQGLTENTAVLKIRTKGKGSVSIFDDIISRLDSLTKSGIASNKETNSQIEKLDRSLADNRQLLDSIDVAFQHMQTQVNEIRELSLDPTLFGQVIENLSLLPNFLKFIQEIPSSQQKLVNLSQDDREFLEKTLANIRIQVDELKSEVKPGNSQNLSDDVLIVLDERLQANEQRITRLVKKIEALKSNDQNSESTVKLEQEIQSLVKRIQDLLDSQGYRPDFYCTNCGNTVVPKNAIYCPSCAKEIGL